MFLEIMSVFNFLHQTCIAIVVPLRPRLLKILHSLNIAAFLQCVKNTLPCSTLSVSSAPFLQNSYCLQVFVWRTCFCFCFLDISSFQAKFDVQQIQFIDTEAFGDCHEIIIGHCCVGIKDKLKWVFHTRIH